MARVSPRTSGVSSESSNQPLPVPSSKQHFRESACYNSQNATDLDHVLGLNVDAIIRGGIKKFTDEVGRLWTSLADYYIRRKLVEKARDIFKEGMTTVVTVRDFSVIFDVYSQFEESMLALKMEEMSDSEVEDEGSNGEVGAEEDVDEEDDRLNVAKVGEEA
ncbi:hypothetical protein H5410_014383 [Solanum commersonii]|uniref:Pre-mRNA-splicing factor SYF1 central HAT repeats domain-containing protein n=1 Tax=Solanum commersonii TaxID=4109 RepID=A0A9J5ZRA5_SOLCO|nr:hypothetical protein H5410_014383 [Solanum commersonii]